MHVCLCFSRSLMLRRWRRQRRQWWCIAQTNTRLVLTKFLLMFQSTLYSVLESAINRLREFFEKAANKNYLSISHCIWSNLWIFCASLSLGLINKSKHCMQAQRDTLRKIQQKIYLSRKRILFMAITNQSHDTCGVFNLFKAFKTRFCVSK